MSATPPTPPESPESPTPRAHRHEHGLSVRDQIERYRSSFIAVVSMVLLAVAVGGYVLAHENLKLPSWVPVLGHHRYSLKAEFQTAQAVTPGQGQAVTIAGAKVGEVASVELHNGLAVVSMTITPTYAHFYHNATLLLRPKTALEDMTIEVYPGTPASPVLHSGEVLPVSQTAPNIDFDQFIAGLDAETRAYLQELLAGAGEGFNGNGKSFAAVLRRFLPTTVLGTEITRELKTRHQDIADSIHNFRLLTEALGGKDEQLAQLIAASNTVFATFAKEDDNLKRTLNLLPGALTKTGDNFAKVASSSDVLGSTLKKLEPFARELAPAQQATRKLALATTPIIKNEVRPFARKILPVVNELAPDTKQVGELFPHLAVSFGVLNEFFNELAYNPGPSKGGFLFFLDWGNHNLNSVVSSADGNGPLGRTVVYFNCEILPIFKGASEVNPTINLLVGLLKPPTKQECINEGLITGASAASSSAKAASTRASAASVRSSQAASFGPAPTLPAATPHSSRKTGGAQAGGARAPAAAAARSGHARASGRGGR